MLAKMSVAKLSMANVSVAKVSYIQYLYVLCVSLTAAHSSLSQLGTVCGVIVFSSNIPANTVTNR